MAAAVWKCPVFSTKPVVHVECGPNADVRKFQYKTPACVMSIAFLLPINRFYLRAGIVHFKTDLLDNPDLRLECRQCRKMVP